MSTRRRLLVQILIFAAIVGGLWYNQHRGLAAVATETRDALCTFRADIQRRYDDGTAFVEDIKAGKRPPFPGFTIQELEQSLENQARTLDALSTLNCP